MLISHEQLKEINKVQIEILRAVSDVCQQLNIKFFIVHGSLLGTIRNHKFVPDDDDIDIALFRKDYELLMREAPKMLEKHYFVQTHDTDQEYPLCFGKIRDSRTTYIVDNARHININHGIYIDVFPIDHCKKKGIRSKIDEFRYKLLSMRIASVFDLKSEPVKKKIVRFGTKIFIPSYAAAIRSREKLLTYCCESGFVRMSGGKLAEQCIPISWFGEAMINEFEEVPVFVPKEYDKYLTKIYGDYRNRTLVEGKISNNKNIEVNACVVDTTTPYTQYNKAYIS